jgi:hypothetical protein
VRRLAPLLALAACGERRAAEDSPAAAASDHAEPAPLRTLDAARLDDLAAVEVPGYTVAARDRSETSLVVSLRAGALRGLVTVGPCLACRPPDAARWRETLPELRQLMPGAVEDDPATQFELHAAEVAGHACITTWELGAMAYGEEVIAAHGARVYCNDGATELVVRVDDDAVATARSPDAARAAAHRDATEAAARTLAEAYLGHL